MFWKTKLAEDPNVNVFFAHDSDIESREDSCGFIRHMRGPRRHVLNAGKKEC